MGNTKDKEIRVNKPLTDRQGLTLFLTFENNEMGICTGPEGVSFPSEHETFVKFSLSIRPSIFKKFNIKETKEEISQMLWVEYFTKTAETVVQEKRQKDWEKEQLTKDL